MKKKSDMVVDNPGLMPYPTNLGAPAFTLPDNIVKGEQRSQNAFHQLQSRFDELKDEYFKLVQLTEDTSIMYEAGKNSIVPVVGRIYHLYKRNDGNFFYSIISPSEWDKDYHGSFKLTSEQIWERVEVE